MSKRSTSIELLRIIFALIIPCYHWILYNGVLYAENSANSIYSLLFFSYIPFACLYGFIAMSSFFLIQKRFKWNAHRFLSFVCILLVIYVFKTVIVNLLFQGYYMNEFIESFFLKGAWWYMYAYLVVMLIYPLLNHVIFNLPVPILYTSTTVLGVLFIYNGMKNTTNFWNDCIAFLFTYFLMGCCERNVKPSFWEQKYIRFLLIMIFALCVLVVTGLCLHYKLFAPHLSSDDVNAIIQKIHTRYTIFGVIGGISWFLLFKSFELPYIPIIHRLSPNTLYIFLTHETVMSVFWFFYVKSAEYLAYLPAEQYWGFILIYIVFCVITAYVVCKSYTIFLQPVFDKLIHKLIRRTENV